MTMDTLQLLVSCLRSLMLLRSRMPEASSRKACACTSVFHATPCMFVLRTVLQGFTAACRGNSFYLVDLHSTHSPSKQRTHIAAESRPLALSLTDGSGHYHPRYQLWYYCCPLRHSRHRLTGDPLPRLVMAFFPAWHLHQSFAYWVYCERHVYSLPDP